MTKSYTQPEPWSNIAEQYFQDAECMRMLKAEKLRFDEMNQYIKNIEEHIRHFKNSGSTVKIEIMNQILLDAQSFIEYYTEE